MKDFKTNKFTLGYINLTGNDGERTLVLINQIGNLMDSDDIDGGTIIEMCYGHTVWVLEDIPTIMDKIDERIKEQETFTQALQEKMLQMRVEELEKLNEVAKCQAEQRS